MMLTGIWMIHQHDSLPPFYTTILPILMLIVLCTAFYFTVWFGIDNMVGSLRERLIRKNLSKMYLNLRNVFHADKNLFFSIQKLSELAMERYGTPEGLQAINDIKKISDSQLLTLTNTLNYIKKMHVKNSTADLIEIIENAISEIEGLPNLTIRREYPSQEVNCYLDAYHLTQLFSNILHNAVEAIFSCRQEGEITIRLTNSREWIFCSITDNGCGMPKKRYRNFQFIHPLQPTKPNHFGIGLPYVHQVIHAHGGHIKYRSKPNTFTAVDILLPQAKER